MTKPRIIKSQLRVNKGLLGIVAALAVGLGIYIVKIGHAGGGPQYNITLSPQSSSAPADNTSTVVISAHLSDYKCTQPEPSTGIYDEFRNQQDCANNGLGVGVPNTVTNTSFYVYANHNGINFDHSDFIYTSDSNGNATIIIKSGIAATITLSGCPDVGCYNLWGQSSAITFTAVSTPAPTPTSTPGPTTKPQPQTATPSSTPSQTTAQPVQTNSTGTTQPSSSKSPVASTKPVVPQTSQLMLAKALKSKAGLSAIGLILVGALLIVLIKVNVIKLPPRR